MINETKLARIIQARSALEQAELSYAQAIDDIDFRPHDYQQCDKPFLLSVGGQAYSITLRVSGSNNGKIILEPDIRLLHDINEPKEGVID